MYGNHELPWSAPLPGFVLRGELAPGGARYLREGGDLPVEKLLAGSPLQLRLQPLRPMHLPRRVARHLLLRLERPLVLGPKASVAVALRFPVELGVFACQGDERLLIDCFSLGEARHTLYGTPQRGLICRYATSPVEDPSAAQGLDPLREARLELGAENPTARWIELTRIVLPLEGLRLHFSPQRVVSAASLRVSSPETAELSFSDPADVGGLEPSLEALTGRVPSVFGGGFTMEHGL